MNGASSVVGDPAVTNGLLLVLNVVMGVVAFELRRAFPYIRAIVKSARLDVKPRRAQSEPGA